MSPSGVQLVAKKSRKQQPLKVPVTISELSSWADRASKLGDQLAKCAEILSSLGESEFEAPRGNFEKALKASEIWAADYVIPEAAGAAIRANRAFNIVLE